MALRTVLSIDWDYFTGDTAVHPGCRGCSWPCNFNWWKEVSISYRGRPHFSRTPHNKSLGARPASSLKNIFSDPLFSEFNLCHWSGARVVAADCHASLFRLLNPGDLVHHVDWHSDDQDDGPVQLWCGNWVTWARQKKGVTVLRRGVHTAGEKNPVTLTTTLLPTEPYALIFLCLSRAYTPPKLDKYFYRFLLGLERVSGRKAEFVGGAKKELGLAFKASRGIAA